MKIIDFAKNSLLLEDTYNEAVEETSNKFQALELYTIRILAKWEDAK